MTLTIIGSTITLVAIVLFIGAEMARRRIKAIYQQLKVDIDNLTQWDAELNHREMALKTTTMMFNDHNRQHYEQFIDQHQELVNFSNQILNLMEEDLLELDPTCNLMFRQIAVNNQIAIEELEKAYFKTFGRNYRFKSTFRSFSTKKAGFGVN